MQYSRYTVGAVLCSFAFDLLKRSDDLPTEWSQDVRCTWGKHWQSVWLAHMCVAAILNRGDCLCRIRLWHSRQETHTFYQLLVWLDCSRSGPLDEPLRRSLALNRQMHHSTSLLCARFESFARRLHPLVPHRKRSRNGRSRHRFRRNIQYGSAL